jgi:protein-S-isoprenylcysteine O-methyltransferase Ste14
MQLHSPEAAIYIAWTLWVLSWILAAIWSSRAASRPGLAVEAAYRVVTIVGVLLLFFTASPASRAPSDSIWSRVHPLVIPLPPVLSAPLWIMPVAGGWACVGVTVLGFAFAWWARIHLGALWSGSITRKADHHIVDTGPYALVRHPIYTGIILAALGLAAVKGTPAALLGAAVLSASFWLKARFEEGFLRQELGADAYDGYRKRVPMLVPFFPA